MAKKVQFNESSEEEYVTLHICFGTNEFKSEIREMIRNNICVELEEWEQLIIVHAKISAEEQESLKIIFHKIRDHYFKRAIPLLYAIDNEIDEVSVIPAPLVTPDNVDDIKNKVKNEFDELRNKIERHITLQCLLTEEYKELLLASKVSINVKKGMEVIELLYGNLKGKTLSINEACKFFKHIKHKIEPSTSGASFETMNEPGTSGTSIKTKIQPSTSGATIEMKNEPITSGAVTDIKTVRRYY